MSVIRRNTFVPFVNIVLTMANLRHKGNVPVSQKQLPIWATGELTVYAQAFNNFVEVSSYL
jgi:hypothetical protein